MKYAYLIPLWLLVLALPLVGFRLSMPLEHSPFFYGHVVKFFFWTLFLGTSLVGLGGAFRRAVLKSNFALTDLALGFGIFALFLSFYLKISLHPSLPLAVLIVGTGLGLHRLWDARQYLRTKLETMEYPVLFLVLALCAVNLLFGKAGSGFLYLSTDFDSSLVHLTMPANIVNRGSFFLPYWVRVPWHPLLTHFWYIFVLETAGMLFVKALNVLAFLQIAVLLLSAESRLVRALGALCLAILTAAPEFANNIASTSLDAGIALFTVSAFVVFCRYLQKPSLPMFALLAALCGFAGGQKHFGLMFSAPVLAIAGLEYIRAGYVHAQSQRIAAGFRHGLHGTALALLFAAIFVPFYIHNTLGGNPLLFPFFGGRQNNYGWDNADLDQMLYDTIPKWGHSKTLRGFFELPYHLTAYPNDYQYALTGTWYDYLISGALVIFFAVLLLSLLFRPARTTALIYPAIVMIAQTALWYRGSQVVRYLFPILINGAALLRHTVDVLSSKRSIRQSQIAASVLLALALGQSALTINRAPLPFPVSQAEQEEWLARFLTPTITSLQYLRDHARQDEAVINISTPVGAQYFPTLTLCGDWFGKCRFNRFADLQMHFKEWPELLPDVREKNFGFIRVSWDFYFPQTARPDPAGNWSGHFPESTARCVEHVFTDNIRTDVFRIKDECR